MDVSLSKTRTQVNKSQQGGETWRNSGISPMMAACFLRTFTDEAHHPKCFHVKDPREKVVLKRFWTIIHCILQMGRHLNTFFHSANFLEIRDQRKGVRCVQHLEACLSAWYLKKLLHLKWNLLESYTLGWRFLLFFYELLLLLEWKKNTSHMYPMTVSQCVIFI